MRVWRIAAFRRTEFCIHPSLLIAAAYAFLMGYGPFFLISFASILLHETAHAVVAWMFGHIPVSIEITPFGCMMRLEDDAVLPPFKQAAVVLAGPLVTFLLALSAMKAAGQGSPPPSFAYMLFSSNVSILLINMLPSLPLDGGRLLSLILRLAMPAWLVMRIMRILGSVLGVALIGLNIMLSWHGGGWNYSLALAGCCLLYAAANATMTHAMTEMRRFLDRKIALEGRGYAPIRRIAVLADQPVYRAVRLLHPRALTEFAVMEQGTLRPLGVVTEERLISCWMAQPETTCGEAVSGEM